MNVYIGYYNLYLLLDRHYSLILKKKGRFIAKLSGYGLLPYSQTPHGKKKNTPQKKGIRSPSSPQASAQGSLPQLPAWGAAL